MLVSEAGAILVFPLAQIWGFACEFGGASWLLGTCLAEITYAFIPCYLASSCHKEVFPERMKGISHRMSNYFYCILPLTLFISLPGRTDGVPLSNQKGYEPGEVSS